MTRKKDIEGSPEEDKCCKRLEVPSEDEVVALNAMRAIKDRVRDLRKRLSEISESILELEQEMAELKVQWNDWEEKREKAARERMILLGHEEGP
jgi:predicted nuclease with TOPRIM domain